VRVVRRILSFFGRPSDELPGRLLAARAVVVAALVAAVLEVALFNLPFWVSLGFVPIDGYEVTYGEGLEPQDGEGSSTYLVTSPDAATITIRGIDAHVDNIHLDASTGEQRLDGYVLSSGPVSVDLSLLDSGEEELSHFATTSAYAPTVESTYLRLHTSKDTQDIQIGLKADAGSVVTIADVAINCVRPFIAELGRMTFVFVVVLICWCLRPRSAAWSTKLSLSSLGQMALGVLLVVTVSVLTLGWSRVRNFESSQNYNNIVRRDQYGQLSEALVDGRLWLDYPVYEWLDQMENPYDPAQRNVYATPDEPCYFDVAFYQGHYYCYFGVVPALLVGCPYVLLTGHAMSDGSLNAVWVCVATAALMLLMRRFVAQRLGGSVGAFLLAFLLTFLGSGLLYHLLTPLTYSVPYGSGFACVFFGLYCWLRGSDQGAIKPGWIAAGSLAMALSVGCRPTFLLAAVLAFPLLWDDIVRRRRFFACGREALLNTFCALLPFVIVAGALCWYNWARFGSPTQFGAAYNLTSNDITHRGFVPARFPLAFFEFLIQPPQIKATFPFLTAISEASNHNTGYLGFTSADPIYGGFLVFNPWAIVCLVWGFSRRDGARHGYDGLLTVTCVVLAAIQLIFVTQYAGISQRYVSDFSWLLCLGALPVFVRAVDQVQVRDEGQARSKTWTVSLRGMLMTCAVMTVALYAATIIMEGDIAAVGTYVPGLKYLVQSSLNVL